MVFILSFILLITFLSFFSRVYFPLLLRVTVLWLYLWLLFLSKSSKQLLLSFNYLNLFVKLVLPLVLLHQHSLPNLQILQFLLLLNLSEIIFQMLHQCSDVLINSQLSPIAYSNSTKWTLFLSQSVIRLNTLAAKSMQTLFVNNWLLHHALTNRAGKCVHYTLDEACTDFIMKRQGFYVSKLGLLLKKFVVNELSVMLLLLFLIMIGQFFLFKL